MILWMLWSIGFVALVAAAAAATERVAGLFGASRRQIWMVAMIVGCAMPAVLAVRRPAVAHQATPAAGSAIIDDSAADSFVSFDVGPRSAAASAKRVTPLVDDATVDLVAAGSWAALSLALLIVLLRGALRMHRASATWEAREVVGGHQVLVSPDSGPAVIGFSRPRIVIPAWTLRLERSEQDLILKHEIEHIRARDPRTLLIAGLLLVLFPWNAALWWMIRRLRLAMELDCDARVIRAAGGAHDYGLVLLAVGERRASPLPFAASLAAPRTFLERRIDAMTAARPRRPMIASLPFIALGLVATTAATRVPRPAPLEPIALGAAVTSAAASTVPEQAAPVPPPAPPTRALGETPVAPRAPRPRQASATVATAPVAPRPDGSGVPPSSAAPMPGEPSFPAPGSAAPSPVGPPPRAPSVAAPSSSGLSPVGPPLRAPSAAPMPGVPSPAAPGAVPSPTASPRPPRPSELQPNRARIISIVKSTMGTVVSGSAPADYIVLLFDGEDQFVWGVSAVGSSSIAVHGDTLLPAQRRALEASNQLELNGTLTTGGAGRGGRGGGDGRGGNNGAVSGNITASGEIMSPRPSNHYIIGTRVVHRFVGREPEMGPLNDAPGLTRLGDGSSGIEGIRADQIAHVDIYHFSKEELGPSAPRVLAVYLVPGVKKP
jgi:beta-lactamase regulating signal transducer with metallopeptidase domain